MLKAQNELFSTQEFVKNNEKYTRLGYFPFRGMLSILQKI